MSIDQAKQVPSGTTDDTVRQARQGSPRAATGVIWLTLVCCLLLSGYLMLGTEHQDSSNKTKLFNLFQGKKYDRIEKRLDRASKTILLGDNEDGIGIFINQFSNERQANGRTIKQRTFVPGVSLEYKNNNILSKSYGYLKSLVSPEIQTSITWIVRTENPLTMGHLQEIQQFSQGHKDSNIVIVTPAISKKAEKAFPAFKVLNFEQLSKEDIRRFLLNSLKLDKVRTNNLLDGFDNHLDNIDEYIHLDQSIGQSFASTYGKQVSNLESLLQMDPVKVEKFLRNMCKKGFLKTKSPLDFIKSNNGIVQFWPSDDSYRWYSQKAIFAVSDKFNTICTTNVEFIHLEGVSPAASSAQKGNKKNK